MNSSYLNKHLKLCNFMEFLGDLTDLSFDNRGTLASMTGAM